MAEGRPDGATGRARAVAVVASVVVVVVVVALAVRRGPDLPRKEAGAYLAGWGRDDPAAMAAEVDQPPADFAAQLRAFDTGLRLDHRSFTLTGLRRMSSGASASFHARLDLAGFGPWEYDGTLALLKTGGRWRVRFDPASLYPGVATGQRLVLHRIWPARAPILGWDGTPLVSQQDAVSVGLEPDHIADLTQVKSVLATTLAIAPGRVDTALGQPGVRPDFFVPIVTVRPDRYQQLRPLLAPVPGIVFRRTTTRLATTDGLAATVVGSVGEITAERLSQLGPPYAVGDTVGLSGLEAAFETRLAGRPAGHVDVVDARGNVVRTLREFPGAAAQPVRTSLDAAVQRAAETALGDEALPSALVAIDAGTGQVRAVVSRPADQPFDRALDGRYPPGSTFKVVTAAALLSSGQTPSSPAPCPPSITVGGRRFTNFEGEAPGAIPLHRAFAISCNTAFVGLAGQLPAGLLQATAARFGFGTTPRLGAPAAGGDIPAPVDAADAAAEAIGQGRVTASPLQLASVAATVDAGGWVAPSLVLDPAPSGTTASGASAGPGPPAPAPAPLDPAVLASLRSMMAEVVTSGTGTAASVPGPPVYGKTGTAEFGNANPPTTHAWFVGFRGPLAFAVLVEGGGVGGRTAAPLAARFLAGLPSS